MAFDRSQIDKWEAGAGTLLAAIKGLSREQLVSFPVPGKWSVQQLVVHMEDSDLVAVHRMKRIIAEDKPPLLIGYDETAFSSKLFPNDQSAEDSARLFELNRRQFARVLRKLPDAAFDRWGVHNERGKVTLGEMVGMYVWHLDHHMKFLDEKLRKLKAV